MPQPPLPDKEHEYRKSLIESALKDGFHPYKSRGGRGSSVEEASRRSGIPESTLSSWVRKQYRLATYGYPNWMPDWELYVQPERPKPTMVPLPDEQAAFGARPENLPPPDPEQRPVVRVRYVADEPGDYYVVAIGDAHDSPSLPDKSRFRWAGAFCREQKPDAIYQIGDMLTFDSINSYDAPGSGRHRQLPTFMEDIESGEEALTAFDEGLGDYECERHITLGNHEDRVWSAEDRAPHTAGMMQLELDRLLAGHGWSYSLYAHPTFLGGVAFSHVPLNIMGKPIGGELATANTALKSIYDWVYGHSHRAEVSRRPKLGGYHVTAINLGCYLPDGHIEHYVKHGSQTGWWYGLWTLRISKGRIQSYQQHSIAELESKYGNANPTPADA